MKNIIIALGIIGGAVVLSSACTTENPPLGSGGSTTSGGAGVPTGGGSTTGGGQQVIPNDCQSYCAEIQASCVDMNAQYLDDDDCFDVCSHWPKGQQNQTNANTLACRNFYLAFADDSPDDAESNCRFAGPHTEGKCGENCFNYCELAQAVCTGDLQQWPSEAACREDCEDWPNNTPYYVGVEGDNFGCRMSYLTIAADNANVTTCENIRGRDGLCEDPPIMMGGMGGMPIGGMGGMMMGGMGGMMMGGMGGMGMGGMNMGGMNMGGMGTGGMMNGGGGMGGN